MIRYTPVKGTEALSIRLSVNRLLNYPSTIYERSEEWRFLPSSPCTLARRTTHPRPETWKGGGHRSHLKWRPAFESCSHHLCHALPAKLFGILSIPGRLAVQINQTILIHKPRCKQTGGRRLAINTLSLIKWLLLWPLFSIIKSNALSLILQ